MKSGVFGATPKMFWTECSVCDKCLDVKFEVGNDIACLNRKFPGKNCIFEGSFINGPNTRVFVSSSQCLLDGTLNKIQVQMHCFH